MKKIRRKYKTSCSHELQVPATQLSTQCYRGVTSHVPRLLLHKQSDKEKGTVKTSPAHAAPTFLLTQLFVG